MSEPKITALEMERQVESEIRELARTGKLPSLETVLDAVVEAREKYRPKILAARTKAKEEAAKRRAYIHGLVLAARQIQIEESQLSLFPKEKAEK